MSNTIKDTLVELLRDAKAELKLVERERDAARERADTMFAKHAEILDQYRRERDAERDLADRLAEALKFIATDKIANANDMRFRANKALTAWKEARSE